MTTSRRTFRGPCYGGPFSASDLEHDEERKDVYILRVLVGFYTFDEDKWLWTPVDATNEAQASN